jgi:hypothetical protein
MIVDENGRKQIEKDDVYCSGKENGMVEQDLVGHNEGSQANAHDGTSHLTNSPINNVQ